jgi:hypothetical protein
VADDTGDALVGPGYIGGKKHIKNGKNDDDVAHARSPIFKVSITARAAIPGRLPNLACRGL